MSSLTTVSTPAERNASAAAWRRGVRDPSSSPSVTRCSLPVCAITPGSAITAPMCVTPPRTRSRPSAPASTSSLSTPFCSDTTAARGTRATARAASSVSQSFTAITARSAGPACAGSSSTRTLTCASPRSLRIRRPFLRMASACAPRATKATSWPACCNRAP